MPRGRANTNESKLPNIISYYFGTKFRPIFVERKRKSRKKVSSKRGKRNRYQKKVQILLSYRKTNFIWARILWFLGIFVCIISLITGTIFYAVILKNLPSPHELSSRNLAVSTKIYDRNGILLYTVYQGENRTPVSLSQIPPQMKLATLASEDVSFYDHPGFSLRGIIRSLKTNWEKGTLRGGSTITQQLVKNTLLSSEKTLTRKVKEVTLAILVERIYSKDQILEMYLNEVPFGGTAYGVQEAAQTFFGKDSYDLTLSESALLAGLPQSPTYYSPYGQDPLRAIERQRQVLSLMQQHGFITEKQKEDAQREPLTFVNHTKDIKAPHFVSYIRTLLEERYGKETVLHGGLSVTTSLDYDIQKLAEGVVSDEVKKLEKMHVTNGAALVLSPQTGEILAMVGSKDYFDTKNSGNVNVTLRPRQPGSSIKIINYGYALSHGFTPISILEDTPVTFLVDGQEPYSPKNYENGFRGRITLRNALAESRNIPAVRLLYANGVENMINLGTEMGITTWEDHKNYGLSLTLGGGEVRLLDLARVYATLVNYGEKPPIKPILKVTNYKGQVLDEEVCDEPRIQASIAESTPAENLSPTPTNSTLQTKPFFRNQVYAANESPILSLPTTDHLPLSICNTTPVLDPRVAFQITDILRDNNARAASFGTNSLLTIPKHPEVAVKTGTSNDLRDNLAIGYTRDYLVSVWVGNNDNSPMGRIASGITGATPIWNKIITPLISQKSSYEWPVPEGLQKVSVCGQREDWFFSESTSRERCLQTYSKPIQKAKQNIQKTGVVSPTPFFKRDVIDLRRNKKAKE